MLAQAVAGGIIESVQGGSFGNGFIAAGMTAALMPGVGNIGNPVGRAIVGALIGGTLSAATGGKFVNGAVSGAVMGAMAGGGAGSDANVADSADQCPTRDGSPSGDSWSFVGSAYREKVHSYFDRLIDSWVVSGELTVSGYAANAVAKDGNRFYHSLQSDIFGGGKRILIDINFTPVSYFGDINVSRFSAHDIAVFSANCITGVRGQMKFYSHTLKLSSITRNDNILSRWERSVPSHEIGHGLGLTHAPNWSRSIMSYYDGRAPMYRDAQNLVDAFR
jgi:hypothetical protein